MTPVSDAILVLEAAAQFQVKEVIKVAGGQRSNQVLVPQARPAMDKFKWETAAAVGINIPQGGYGGDIPSKMWGAVGGNMVRTMIQAYEQSLAGQPAQVTTKPTP